LILKKVVLCGQMQREEFTINVCRMSDVGVWGGTTSHWGGKGFRESPTFYSFSMKITRF